MWEHVVAASASGQDVGELVVKRCGAAAPTGRNALIAGAAANRGGGLWGLAKRPRSSEAGGRQTLSLRLAAPPNQADLAGEYALASAPKGRAYVFAEAENSTAAQLATGTAWAAINGASASVPAGDHPTDVSFEGTVAEQYNAIPRQARPFTAAWAAAAEDEKVTANVISVADEMAGPLDTIGQAREVSKAVRRAPADGAEVLAGTGRAHCRTAPLPQRRLRRGNALQEMRAREANMADRHERLPEEQVQSMLFDLFARQQYWTFRDLVDKTNQPAVRGGARTARPRPADAANGWARGRPCSAGATNDRAGAPQKDSYRRCHLPRQRSRAQHV